VTSADIGDGAVSVKWQNYCHEIADECQIDVSKEPSWFQNIWNADLSEHTAAEREWRRKNKWDRGTLVNPDPLPEGVCTDEPGDPAHFVSGPASQLWHRRIWSMTRDEFALACTDAKNPATIAYEQFLDALDRREEAFLKREQALPQSNPNVGYEALKRKSERRAEQAKEEPPIVWRRVSELQDKPVPTRQWLVENFIPYRNVTNHTGDGGVGKSLLDLQLAVGTAKTGKWVGMPVKIQGPVIVFSAEDEFEETWRRLAAICQHEKIELKELSNLHVAPLAGMDAMLAVADDRKMMVPTYRWHELRSKVDLVRPVLIIIDTSADVYGGDENTRHQVRQFVGLLRGLAFDFDCAVVLLSHPSVSGMIDGTGRSGTTGWNNSFRGRMYQERVLIRDDKTIAEPDPDLRVLRNNKLNYGKAGAEIRIRYDDKVHVFVNVQADEVSAADAAIAAEQVFLECLAEIESQGRGVGPNKGVNYAPKKFASMPQAKGYTAPQLARAMDRLLADRKIRYEETSRGSGRLTTKPASAPVLESESPEPAPDSALDRAVQFLRERLAAGPVSSGEVNTEAKEALISKGTLYRAANKIGVKSDKDGFITMLRLP
jgi:RecA-family ATPase